MTDDDLYADAACIGLDTNIFFPSMPNHDKGPRPDIWAPARAVCGVCPIQSRCLNDHMRERFGMWGGTTPEERGIGYQAVGPRSVRTVRGWVLSRRGADVTTNAIVAATGYCGSTVRQVLRTLEREGHVERHGRSWRVLGAVVGA